MAADSSSLAPLSTQRSFSSSPTIPNAVSDSPPSSPSPPPHPQTAAPAGSGCGSEQGSLPATSTSNSSGLNTPTDSSVENGGNSAPLRRPAWNRPANGVVEPVSVMGGSVSWPALSESTRPGSRSTTDASRPVSNGLSSPSQGPSVHQSTPRQVNYNANANGNPNSNTSHSMSGRQRSMRHRGGGGSSNNHNGGGSAHGGFNRPPPPPPPPMPPAFPVIEIPYGTLVPPVALDSSVRSPRVMGGLGPQQHAPSDHSSHRNSSRRGNFGPRPRGDGSYHNNHGSRRDQDRRDVPMQQFAPSATAFIPPPPPGTPPPFGHLPMRPFHGPMGFDMASPFIYIPTLPSESFRGVPLIAQGPPLPVFFMEQPNLPMMIVNQIDYYFSDENLVKDEFLRKNMDEEGWVPISLIANFPRVAQLSSSTEFILECMKSSTAVEIQADKLRRCDDWKRWLHTPARSNGDTDSHTMSESTENSLANTILNISLDEAAISRDSGTKVVDAQTDTETSICSSGDFTVQSNADGNTEDVSAGQSQTVC